MKTMHDTSKRAVLSASALPAILLASLPLSSTSAQDPGWRAQASRAQEYKVTGETAKAIDSYREAAAEAPAGPQRATVMVELGVLYDEQAAGDNGRHQIEESAAAFRAAMQQSGGELHLQAANNYAAQLLRLGEPERAVDVLRKVAVESAGVDLDPVAASRSAFNFGRALEEVGDYPAAGEQYMRAFETDPKFEPAEQSVARLALAARTESTGLPQLINLTSTLFENGNYETASRYLREGLNKNHWWHDPAYSELVNVLVRGFTLTQISPADFEKNWANELVTLAHDLSDTFPRESTRLQDIQRVYFDELPIHFDSWNVRQRFPAWEADGGYGSLSVLLKTVGDQYSRGNRSDMALQRYANAWALDSTNMDAGLYLANLLVVAPERDYLDQFLLFAFQQKAKAYLGEDWESILKFHTVLGTLFERMEVWGPQGNARSAIFQWQHALRAHLKLGEARSELQRGRPAIREHLALAFAADGNAKNAWAEYVNAAEEYLVLAQIADADQAMNAAAQLEYRADAEGQQRFDRIQADLAVQSDARQQ